MRGRTDSMYHFTSIHRLVTGTKIHQPFCFLALHCVAWSWLLCPRRDDGYISLLAAPVAAAAADGDDQSENLAVCRLRSHSNLPWPNTRILSQKTAHDDTNTYSGVKAASFRRRGCQWIRRITTCSVEAMMCWQAGLPPHRVSGESSPCAGSEKDGSAPGAV